jgi:hypothetical protein
LERFGFKPSQEESKEQQHQQQSDWFDSQFQSSSGFCSSFAFCFRARIQTKVEKDRRELSFCDMSLRLTFLRDLALSSSSNKNRSVLNTSSRELVREENKGFAVKNVHSGSSKGYSSSLCLLYIYI